MNQKALYTIIGVLLGAIVTMVVIMMPGRAASQGDPANISFGSAKGVIALTTVAPRTDVSILWLIDVEKKNLLLYEYADENRIKLKALRDIQFDLGVPKGFYMPTGRRDDLKPFEIEERFKEWAEKLEKIEAQKRKREEKLKGK